MKNYYEILKLKNNASFEEIKKNYRALAREYHPDKNQGNHKKEDMFKLINEAYSVLSDEQKRKTYDESFNKQKNSSSSTKTNSSSNASSFSSNKFDINDFEKRFENFFGFNTDGNKLNKKENKTILNTNEMFNNFFKVKK